jgi:hypothetical protein
MNPKNEKALTQLSAAYEPTRLKECAEQGTK